MRPIRLLLLYFLVVFAGGAMLAPCLYWATRRASLQWSALASLAANPFHRFLARSLLFLALVGLVPLLQNCGMLRWRALGLGSQGRPAMNLLRGFGLGFVSLACVALFALGAHGRMWVSQPAAHMLYGLAIAAITALIVAVLEEILFRGALFGILRKVTAWPGALVISSAIYSTVHFIQNTAQEGTVRWYSGLTLLVEMFRHGPPLIPAFLTLFVAGACLAFAYQQTGSLYFSIGLHAGWIFWLKSYKLVTQPVAGANLVIWGSDRLIDGWLSLTILSVVFGALSAKLGNRERA